MSETKSDNTIVRQTVEDLSDSHAEPLWLKELRLSAWETYLNTPMPTSAAGDWRRTEIDSLNLSDLTTLELAAPSTTSPKWPAWFSKALSHARQPAGIFFETSLNASYIELSSNLKDAGVIFEPIGVAVENHGDLIRPYLCAELNNDAHLKFSSMNKALFKSGFFLYVPSEVQIDLPFITGINVEGSPAQAACQGIFSYVIVVAGSHSKLNVWRISSSSARNSPLIESGNGLSSKDNLLVLNEIVHVHVGKSAKVNYLEVKQLGKQSFAVGLNHNEIHKDGFFTSLTVAAGGKQTKTDIATLLQGPGAQSKVLGIVLGDNKENFNFNTIQEHNAPDTKSDIDFRVALNDAATSVYQGIIRVAKLAQKTDAYQSNKNLLLGSQARADSIPKLEILADDVKCSHGATVGPVDKEQIFYLMSRGMPLKQAEELIVQGFCRKIIEQFEVSGVSEFLEEIITHKVIS